MRDAGQNPSIVRITTTETLAEITAPEYLKTQTEAIQQINFGPFEWVEGDLVSIDYADGEGFFAYDSINGTFVQSGGGGSGANVNLSNLEAPTALNQDILPNGDRTRALGSETNRFQEVYFGDWRVPHNVDDPFPDNATISAWNSGTNSWDLLAAFLSGPAPGIAFYKNTLLLNGLTNVTPAPGDNSHKLADTAFVQQELSNYVPPAPPAPDWGDIGGTLSDQTDLQNVLNSKADISSLGDYATLLCNLNAVVDPTAGDDSGGGYDIGSRWINVNTNKEFVCVDDAVGGAIWEETTFDRYTYETLSSTSSIEFPYGFGWEGKTILSPSFPPTDNNTNLYFPAYDADTGAFGNILATRQSVSTSSIPSNGHVAVMPYNSGSTNKICTSFHYSKLVMGQDGPGYCAPFTSTGKSSTVSLSPDNNNAIAGLVFLQRGLYKRVSIYVKAADAGMQAEAAIYSLGNNRRAGLIESEISAPVSLGSTGEVIMIIDTDPIAGKRFGGFFWVVIRFIGTRTTLEIDACDGQNINLFVPMTTKTGESVYTMKYNSFSTFPASLGSTVPASFHGITECPYFVVGPSV